MPATVKDPCVGFRMGVRARGRGARGLDGSAPRSFSGVSGMSVGAEPVHLLESDLPGSVTWSSPFIVGFGSLVVATLEGEDERRMTIATLISCSSNPGRMTESTESRE